MFANDFIPPPPPPPLSSLFSSSFFSSLFFISFFFFQNDETVLRRRLHGLVEDGGKPEVVRRCAAVLREMARHKLGGFFLFPMDERQFPEYYAVIEEPITVQSLHESLESWSSSSSSSSPSAGGGGSGSDEVAAAQEAELVDSFTLSVRRMWENCWSYNHEGTEVRVFMLLYAGPLPCPCGVSCRCLPASSVRMKSVYGAGNACLEARPARRPANASSERASIACSGFSGEAHTYCS